MCETNKEEKRILSTYSDRDAKGKRDLYAWHKSDVLFTQYRLRQKIIDLFRAENILDFSRKEILDVGCGAGQWLRTLQEWGADAGNLHGIDLIENRIHQARCMAPHIDYRQASAWPIPFDDNSMDLIFAQTVFSSILAADARSKLADEMKRVIKTGGYIVVYDFNVSHPGNENTIGISMREIKRLFPGCDIQRRLLTLAPPLQRRLSPLMSYLLEVCMPFLMTHSVYLIKV